ncbi:MAG: DUF3592 domain-containing protein [Eubacterium sp.]|nr:DUF3592 domain-containing protein [Eubacterium sp.]
MIERFKNNPVLTFSLILCTMGIIFGLIQLKDNSKYDKEVVAVVKSVNSYYDNDEDIYKYQAVCEYEVGGKTYKYTTGYSSRRYRTFDEIVIKINSDYPERANKHIFKKIAAVFLFFGVMFLLISFKEKFE